MENVRVLIDPSLQYFTPIWPQLHGLSFSTIDARSSPIFKIIGVISLIHTMGVIGVFGSFRFDFECDYDNEILPLDAYNYKLVVVLSLAPITLMHAVCLIWNDLTTQSAYVLSQCLNAWMRFNLMFLFYFILFQYPACHQ